MNHLAIKHWQGYETENYLTNKGQTESNGKLVQAVNAPAGAKSVQSSKWTKKIKVKIDKYAVTIKVKKTSFD